MVSFISFGFFHFKTDFSSDPAMKQFLLHLDDTLALGRKFVLNDLDETHLYIDSDIVPLLETRIDSLMEQLAPDIAEK